MSYVLGLLSRGVKRIAIVDRDTSRHNPLAPSGCELRALLSTSNYHGAHRRAASPDEGTSFEYRAADPTLELERVHDHGHHGVIAVGQAWCRGARVICGPSARLFRKRHSENRWSGAWRVAQVPHAAQVMIELPSLPEITRQRLAAFCAASRDNREVELALDGSGGATRATPVRS
jgi:hypothetical protein